MKRAQRHKLMTRNKPRKTTNVIDDSTPTPKTPQIGAQGRLRTIDEMLLRQRESAAAARALNDLLTARHNPNMMLAILAPAWKEETNKDE